MAIREDLGKVNRLISVAVEDHMTGKASRVELDSMESTASRDLYRFERHMREQIDAARADLAESIDVLRITPANAEHITAVALDLADQSPLAPNPGIAGTFWIGARSGIWADAALGLADPLTGAERPITFDPSIADAHHGDVVLTHLNHPLVATATRLLRAEVWGQATGAHSSLHRVAVLRIRDEVSEGDLVVAAFCRLVIAGADGVRLHEEVFAAGGRIHNDGQRWTRLTVGRLEHILNTALDDNATVSDLTWPDMVAEDWGRWSERLSTAINARAKERVDSLTRALDKRRDTDVERITAVLTNLETQIRSQLSTPAAEQLDLFDHQDERDQYTADRDAWGRRLAEIPHEMERETAAIRARYADVRDYVFPAAVLICVPDALAGDPR